MANLNHADYNPSLSIDEKEGDTITVASGNTKTVTNAKVRAGNVIFLHPLSAYTGTYFITVSNGSFLVTFSDAVSNLTFKYRIL